MKLTSSGNVMLVTFSFSRQRDGAIFKAYFQAIPKAGLSPLTNTTNHLLYCPISTKLVSYACNHDSFTLISTCKTVYLPSLPTGCGGTISSWNGSLSSPYYPSYYPPNIDCIWTLRVSHVCLCLWETRKTGWLIRKLKSESFFLWSGMSTFQHVNALVIHSLSLYQAPLPGYLISMTIVTMDIQESSSSDGCEKDWLDIAGIKWVMKQNCEQKTGGLNLGCNSCNQGAREQILRWNVVIIINFLWHPCFLRLHVWIKGKNPFVLLCMQTV